jgi:hypothetical protein
MSATASLARVTAAVVLLALGCKKNPDPLYIDISDFNSGKQLTDTLKRLIPVGTRVPLAWQTMQTSGFKCGESSLTTVDTTTHKLGSGAPYLECGISSRIDFGMRRRVWTVEFHYDSAGVKDILAGYMIQP